MGQTFIRLIPGKKKIRFFQAYHDHSGYLTWRGEDTADATDNESLSVSVLRSPKRWKRMFTAKADAQENLNAWRKQCDIMGYTQEISFNTYSEKPTQKAAAIS